MTTRAEAKAETRRRLLDAAWSSIADRGASSLTLREVARDAGVVPSAVYRHFESRDALITHLLVEGYGNLADHLAATPLGDAPWSSRTSALRTWAIEHPQHFALLYGTPIPGYAAPPETIPAAARVATALLAAAPEDGPATGPVAPALRDQVAPAAADLGVEPEVLARTLAALSQLVGILLLEAGGHFVGTAEPADLLWRHAVDAQRAGTTLTSG